MREPKMGEIMVQGATRSGSGGMDLFAWLPRSCSGKASGQTVRFRGLKSRPGLPDKTMMVMIVTEGRFCA